MKKKVIINVLIVICICVMVGSGGYLGFYYYNSHKSEKNMDELREMIDVTEEQSVGKDESQKTEEPQFVTINGVSVQKKFENLYKSNKDFVGWIKIDGTNVDYPVMHTPNDSEYGEYYIKRNFGGEYSAAGVPFIDRNCILSPPTDNIIIYGHNMNSGKMFHDILKYEDEEFYNAHKTITFDTIYGDGEYEVVAAFYGQILAEDSKEFKYYQFVNAGSEEEFTEFVNNIKRKSVVDTGVSVEYGDELITLSTCAYHIKNGRFAVIAKKKKEETSSFFIGSFQY